MSASMLMPGDCEVVRKLVWFCRNTEGWEMLIYTRADLWDAYFFFRAIHHEHACGGGAFD